MEERLHKSASLLISAHHDEELLLLYGFSAKPLASLCFQVLQDLHFFLAYNLVRQVTRIKLSFIQQYMYVQRAVVLVMITRIPYFVANFFCRRASVPSPLSHLVSPKHQTPAATIPRLLEQQRHSLLPPSKHKNIWQSYMSTSIKSSYVLMLPTPTSFFSEVVNPLLLLLTTTTTIYQY